jgi:hypothetical protein
VEFQELNERLSQIYEELREARDKAEIGLKLIDKLTIDILRENALRKDKEEQDGGSDPIQR